MRVSNISSTIIAPIEKVWDVLTDIEHTSWRSDLLHCEKISEDDFREYTTKKTTIDVHITCKKPYGQYEFDMKNKYYTGHWIGILKEVDQDMTQLELHQKINIHSRIVEFLSCFFMDLDKYQRQYVTDLKEEVKRRSLI